MKKTNSGFTLIELMVVLVIFAIIAGFGLPMMTRLIASNQASSDVNSLVTALQLARSEALRRGEAAAVCASPNPNASPPSCEASADPTDWSNGWIAFVDDDGSGTDGEYDSASETLIQVFDGVGSAGTTLSGDDAFVRYSPEGFRNSGATAIEHRVENCEDNLGRQVNISNTGRPEVVQESC